MRLWRRRLFAILGVQRAGAEKVCLLKWVLSQSRFYRQGRGCFVFVCFQSLSWMFRVSVEPKTGRVWQGPQDPSGPTSPQAGTPRAGCPGPCPGGFGDRQGGNLTASPGSMSKCSVICTEYKCYLVVRWNLPCSSLCPCGSCTFFYGTFHVPIRSCNPGRKILHIKMCVLDLEEGHRTETTEYTWCADAHAVIYRSVCEGQNVGHSSYCES